MALEGFVGLPHTHIYSFLNFIYLLLIFLAYWVFIAVCGLSLIVVHSLFSLPWLPLLWHVDSRAWAG